MSKQLKAVSLIGFFFGALFAQAQAAVITYHLQDVVFNDGGTASGSFDFDTETNAFSNVNIVTTAGSVLGGTVHDRQVFEYEGEKAAYFTDFDLEAAFNSDDPDFTGASLFYASRSAIGSGTFSELGVEAVVAFSDLDEYLCLNADCSESSIRYAYGGSFSFVTYDLAEVPIPAALPLFLTGLAGLGFAKRRKRVAID